ncbi:uncharacterized protein Z518_04589 [Rhinocladiella mackenziei CBS 650.93]|uniref:Xylanolytic transcriptional activator regulatory domain-containing protein n=1 Tax=Rhinocladiella mackenziei CBS 650.93 TaxID=1442369 RepID=A0A0D2H864_9EURO|nr:uncharacterized protein Z518_04589 [Rhinocladiella mackenziei CBS 650.93]KIX06613.1 hypothetical protein Z518_04589 [Rhinocladiella mackenziei CBS 650.93]
MTTFLSLVDTRGYEGQNQESPFRWKSIQHNTYHAPKPSDRRPSIQEAEEQLPKDVRDDLVVLYFRNVHPLCPVIDEYEFASWYSNCTSDEELFGHCEIVLFQAMMFMAFAHLRQEQLNKTPYSSIPHGQKTLLNKVKVLYDNDPSGDHVVLTKVCLLLSYWSPYDSDLYVNSHWVGRAFFHARQARLWDPDCDSGAMFSRRKLTWWCCRVRDRLVALGLRRLHRLHEKNSTWPMVTSADFGAEAICPKYMPLNSKKVMMGAFIWLCKLSELMAEIGEFQLKTGFDREWRGKPEETNAIMQRIVQTSKFESRVNAWVVEFGFEDCERTDEEYIGMSKLPLRKLQILSSSLIAALYRPYLRNSEYDQPLEISFRGIAVTKVKEASARTARSVHKAFAESPIEEVPLAIFAWIQFPVAVCQVDYQFNGGDSLLFGATQRSTILASMKKLGERFSGAKVACQTINAVMQITSERIKQNTLKLANRCRFEDDSADDSIPVQESEEEADILDCVARIIDLTLAQATVRNGLIRCCTLDEAVLL